MNSALQAPSATISSPSSPISETRAKCSDENIRRDAIPRNAEGSEEDQVAPGKQYEDAPGDPREESIRYNTDVDKKKMVCLARIATRTQPESASDNIQFVPGNRLPTMTKSHIDITS